MYFFCQHYNHPLKITTPFFPATSSKNWGPVKPPLFENLVGGSPPPPPPSRKGGGGGGEGVGGGGTYYVHPTEENGTTIDTED